MGIRVVVKPGFYRPGRSGPGIARPAPRPDVEGSGEEPEEKQAQRDAAEPEEAELAVTQLHQLAEAPTPPVGR